MGRWLRCVSGEAASIKANESASNTESLVQFKHLTKFGYIPADFMGCGGRCRVDSSMVVVGGKGESMDKRPMSFVHLPATVATCGHSPRPHPSFPKVQSSFVSLLRAS